MQTKKGESKHKMLQIKISITEEECALLQERANKNLNSLSREARLILRHVLYNEIPTPACIDPVIKPQPLEIAGIPFPAFPDYKITSTPTSHTHADITPPGVQLDATQTVPSQPTTTTQITPDPHAGTIDIKPGILPNPVKDYTQAQTQSEQKKRVIDLPLEEKPPSTPKSYKNNIQPTLTDIEIEQVDNEWDAEGHKYSTEDFIFDLKQLEAKLKEDLPLDQDPTRDPDYITLKKYFIKNDLRERFRSLLSDPQRFYPEEGVYDPPQIRYARAAFRKEKIDEDYIVALLSGTGADYRRTNKCEPYTH
ncbi:MAG: hypothetical protein IKB64_01085 [Paludibacteraceae bacterium]|nr:hypothetical protein [Paludibacteraceae bacterium]